MRASSRGACVISQQHWGYIRKGGTRAGKAGGGLQRLREGRKAPQTTSALGGARRLRGWDAAEQMLIRPLLEVEEPHRVYHSTPR